MKVLLATDGSEHARLAEVALAKTPGAAGAHVVVVTVGLALRMSVADVEPLGPAVLGEQLRDIQEASQRQAESAAEAAASRLIASGFSADVTVLEGDAAHEILSVAEQANVDLIALGSRGLGTIQSFVLGSVARKVLNGANASLLIAHPYRAHSIEDSLMRLSERALPRVVFGTDGSPGASFAVDWLKRGGAGACEKIWAVCAEPLSVVPAGVDPSMFAMVYEYDRQRVEAVAQHAKGALAGVAPAIESFTDIGRPVDVLCDCAERERADLMIVGATQHGALERFLIGSVSYEVAVKAPCSVLVVRPAVHN